MGRRGTGARTVGATERSQDMDRAPALQRLGRVPDGAEADHPVAVAALRLKVRDTAGILANRGFTTVATRTPSTRSWTAKLVETETCSRLPSSGYRPL